MDEKFLKIQKNFCSATNLSLRRLTVCCRVETENKIFHRREKLPTILNQRARRGLRRFLHKTRIFIL